MKPPGSEFARAGSGNGPEPAANAGSVHSKQPTTRNANRAATDPQRRRLAWRISAKFPQETIALLLVRPAPLLAPVRLRYQIVLFRHCQCLEAYARPPVALGEPRGWRMINCVKLSRQAGGCTHRGQRPFTEVNNH